MMLEMAEIIGNVVRKVNGMEVNRPDCIVRSALLIHSDLFRYEDAKSFVAEQSKRDVRHRVREIIVKDNLLTEKAEFYLRIHGYDISWMD